MSRNFDLTLATRKEFNRIGLVNMLTELLDNEDDNGNNGYEYLWESTLELFGLNPNNFNYDSLYESKYAEINNMMFLEHMIKSYPINMSDDAIVENVLEYLGYYYEIETIHNKANQIEAIALAIYW